MSSPRPTAEKSPSLRERRAQLTRDEILRAARQLFAERGYARTSVRDIAKAAGVSAQTVYDSVGSKQALVSRLNDLIDSEAGIAATARAAAESDDPWELAATAARITRSILEHCGDIVHALVTGAAAEPELAAALAEGHRRHVEGVGRVVDLLRRLDALGPLDRDDAVETLAAITDVRFALVLRESYGWPLDRLESWMAATSRTLLLRAPGVGHAP
jgi:AcrR family transcriptional regulator